MSFYCLFVTWDIMILKGKPPSTSEMVSDSVHKRQGHVKYAIQYRLSVHKIN